jgi:zinc transporter
MKTHSFPPAGRSGDGAPPLQWIVLDGRDADDRTWIASQSGFDDAIKDSVAQSPVRNDRVRLGAAIVLALVRMGNAGKGEHEGMEIVIEPHRIVTVCYGTEAIVDQALERQADGASPMGTGRALALLVATLVKPLEREVTHLSDRIGELEDAAMKESDEDGGMDDSVVLVGRQVLDLRRYLAPMHDELTYLALNPDELPGQADPRHLRRAADSLARLVSALDSSHNRILLILSQLRNRDSARDSRSMHKLTIVATVFLPLGFITGLLGINVAGIPDSHNPYGFWAVCGFLIAVAVGAIVLIRWRKWM